MGATQLLWVVASVAILVTLQLFINSSIIKAYSGTLDNEATIDAVSVAQAMEDEINTKAYDTHTVGTVVHYRNQLTPYTSFGPEAGEAFPYGFVDRAPFQSVARFNDVDDYQFYARVDSSSRLGNFIVRDTVIYVSETNQTSFSSTQTWYKKVIITVTHPNLLNPIKMKSLFVYREYFD